MAWVINLTILQWRLGERDIYNTIVHSLLDNRVNQVYFRRRAYKYV